MSRLPDPGFDPRIADWLEADPSIAPPDLVRTVSAAIPSIPQRRVMRLPWRSKPMNRVLLLVAAAALAAVVGLGVLGVGSKPRNDQPSSTVQSPAAILPSATTPPGNPSPAPSPTPAVARLGGQILVEHFGNAPDGSESTQEMDPSKRRLYLMDPNNMQGTAAREFLPGTPSTGKTSPDVSRDGRSVVFMDWSDASAIYVANLDGTGFRRLTPAGCECDEWDPAFDPTGTRVVYGHAEGKRAWLEIRDLATGNVAKVPGTASPITSPVPESPAWSPDGSEIAFTRTAWGDGKYITPGMVHYWTGSRTGVLSAVNLDTGGIQDLLTPGLVPGDPDWSSGSSLLLFTNNTVTKGGDDTNHAVYTIAPDGSGLTEVITAADSATWTADDRILSTLNYFVLSDADGSNLHLVDLQASDNTEADVGFVYAGWYIGTP